MHIPDGYLSPSTCLALYAGAAPFWYTAFRRVRYSIGNRTVPLLSAFSACSFVIMMFNLPLPGGTSGHAVGMAVSAIVLGPWASIITISLALFIQALLFGDGGITTFGANSFNMAIVGSFVAIAVYRLVSGGADRDSPRRVFAAVLAGYTAINASAFCAAIEFGLQPTLFRDVNGTPLYAFYPLSVALPAMMIGHLTLAGFTEAIISGGVVAYFQKSDPSLLENSAPDVTADGKQKPYRASRSLAPIWTSLALLLILTPLGLLAGGAAWGEWGPADFENSRLREEISQASLNVAPPEHASSGMLKLASLWTAPMPGYAPPFLKSELFGYLMSAMLGSGLIISVCLLLGRLSGALASGAAAGLNSTADTGDKKVQKGRTFRGHKQRNVLFQTLEGITNRLERAFIAEDLAQKSGLLQSLDPRMRIVCLVLLLTAVIESGNLFVILVLLVLGLLIAGLSRISIWRLVLRAWIAVLLFTGLIAVPALFITPGKVIASLPVFGWPISAQGTRAMLFLLSRAGVSVTLSLAVVMSTRWTDLLKALRSLGVPVVVVAMLGMTHRYIFLLIQTTQDMFESRQSRMVGRLHPSVARRMAIAAAGVLLSKSFELSSDVHMAMQSRGYRGESKLMNEFSIRFVDWLVLLMVVIVAVLAIWFGRLPDGILA